MIDVATFTVSWMIIDPLGTGWSWSTHKHQSDYTIFQNYMKIEPMFDGHDKPE